MNALRAMRRAVLPGRAARLCRFWSGSLRFSTFHKNGPLNFGNPPKLCGMANFLLPNGENVVIIIVQELETFPVALPETFPARNKN